MKKETIIIVIHVNFLILVFIFLKSGGEVKLKALETQKGCINHGSHSKSRKLP